MTLEFVKIDIFFQIVQIWVISSHLKLWLAVARHNFKWLEIKFYV